MLQEPQKYTINNKGTMQQ